MALSINEIKRQRQQALREIKRRLKVADSQLEKTERTIERLLERKVKMPELTDFTDILLSLEEVAVASNAVYTYVDETVLPYFENM